MSNKNRNTPNTPIVMQGSSVRIIPPAPGETIAEMCARLAGSGPTHTALAESAKPPTIYAPRTNTRRRNRMPLLVIVAIAVVIAVLVITTIANAAGDHIVYMPQLSVAPIQSSSWIAPTATPTPQPELGEPPFVPVGASGE